MYLSFKKFEKVVETFIYVVEMYININQKNYYLHCMSLSLNKRTLQWLHVKHGREINSHNTDDKKKKCSLFTSVLVLLLLAVLGL